MHNDTNMSGFLLVDKPAGCTSFDVISRCRKIFNMQRVGHSGTLDPFATGLLIIALGEACKMLEYLPGEPKVYEGSAILGASSTTYDCDGDIIPSSGLPDPSLLNLSLVQSMAQRHFTGTLQQVPPKYSAVKVRGVSAHARVRRGETVELAPKSIQVSRFDIFEFSYPRFSFSVEVSRGTYIRSLIHELGAELLVGAYVQSLRRVTCGPFDVKNTSTLDYLEKLSANSDTATLSSHLLPLEVSASELPRVDLDSAAYLRLSHGLFIPVPSSFLSSPLSTVFAAFFEDCLVGVLEFSSTNELKFRKMLHRF